MKSNKKFVKVFKMVMMCLVTMVLLTCGCGKKEEKNNNNNNNNNNPVENNGVVLNEVNKDGLRYNNASVIYENGVSTLSITVTNTSGANKNVEMINIRLYDDSDNLIKETKGYVGKTLSQNESKVVTTQITYDLRRVKRVDYSI